LHHLLHHQARRVFTRDGAEGARQTPWEASISFLPRRKEVPVTTIVTTRRISRRRLGGVAGFAALPFLAACGARARPSAEPASSDAAGASPSASSAAGSTLASGQTGRSGVAGIQSAGPLTFQVQPEQSKATFRVREQLARLPLPNDAVGTTGAVTGQLVLDPMSGVVSDASKITVDLRQLATDSAQRDNFIKRNTLQTDQFPTAEFVPVRAEGLPTPIPESGEFTFRLSGPMTVRGVQKDVTWDVSAARSGGQITGTATTAVTFGDFGMEPPKVPVVLSVVDEIRLELNLVASEAA
jgi:polyisoprenoid-binding protein YceI